MKKGWLNKETGTALGIKETSCKGKELEYREKVTDN